MDTGITLERGLLSIAVRRMLSLVAFVAWASSLSYSQSTFGFLLGTVHDPTNAAISNCKVTFHNSGTSAERSTVTDQTGSYLFSNMEPGAYSITMESPGFQRAKYTEIEITGRQTVRIDGQLALTTQNDSVNVTVASESPINTEVSNIAETKSGKELVDLPIAIGSRGSGSTSPMSTLTTQPGVQTDAGGGISVSGSKPSMLSISIDGLSSLGPRTAGPLVELFPSFYAIAEIRVSEVNNTAEFGGISDITTISKSGTNLYHGGGFENLQNTVLDSRNPFNATRPKQNMNDFGGYLGGPVMIPKLGGRTGGYHGVGQGDVDFPRSRANLKIWVIEPSSSGPAKTHSFAVAGLPSALAVVKDQWTSTSLLHYQDKDTL